MNERRADGAVGTTAQEPVLKLNFLSHGTLESYDLEKSREFYERFLGLEVVRTSELSLMVRLGNTNTIAVVQNPSRKEPMPLLNHNGLDVATREEVDEAHRLVTEQKERWGIKKITRPVDQHGTHSFYFLDRDDNWWEILANPPDGYAWMFKKSADIDNWGAGEDAGFNPNEYTKLIKRKGPPPR